ERRLNPAADLSVRLPVTHLWEGPAVEDPGSAGGLPAALLPCDRSTLVRQPFPDQQLQPGWLGLSVVAADQGPSMVRILHHRRAEEPGKRLAVQPRRRRSACVQVVNPNGFFPGASHQEAAEAVDRGYVVGR